MTLLENGLLVQAKHGGRQWGFAIFKNGRKTAIALSAKKSTDLGYESHELVRGLGCRRHLLFADRWAPRISPRSKNKAASRSWRVRPLVTLDPQYVVLSNKKTALNKVSDKRKSFARQR
jgi:hypothetical protein